MLRSLLTVSALELRTRVRDRTALIIAIIAPVAMATLFGVALGGDDPPLRATVGIVDLDGGEFPAGVRREVMASTELDGVLTLRDLPGREQAQSALDAGDIGAAIIFPAGFSAECRRGRGRPGRRADLGGHATGGGGRERRGGPDLQPGAGPHARGPRLPGRGRARRRGQGVRGAQRRGRSGPDPGERPDVRRQGRPVGLLRRRHGRAVRLLRGRRVVPRAC